MADALFTATVDGVHFGLKLMMDIPGKWVNLVALGPDGRQFVATSARGGSTYYKNDRGEIEIDNAAAGAWFDNSDFHKPFYFYVRVLWDDRNDNSVLSKAGDIILSVSSGHPGGGAWMNIGHNFVPHDCVFK